MTMQTALIILGASLAVIGTIGRLLMQWMARRSATSIKVTLKTDGHIDEYQLQADQISRLKKFIEHEQRSAVSTRKKAVAAG